MPGSKAETPRHSVRCVRPQLVFHVGSQGKVRIQVGSTLRFSMLFSRGEERADANGMLGTPHPCEGHSRPHEGGDRDPFPAQAQPLLGGKKQTSKHLS